MFYDRDYWGASGNLKVELNNVSSTLPLLSYSSLELGCDNKYQTYYRFVAEFVQLTTHFLYDDTE